MAFVTRIIRPDDLLNLHIQGINLRIDTEDALAPVVVIETPDRPAYLVVTFPPQTIAERAFFEADIVPADPQEKNSPTSGQMAGDPLSMPGQIPARMAHSSRLVFEVPAEARIPYTIAGLLDWSNLELHVSGIAAIPPDPSAAEISQAPTISAPAATETALELPYRLVISPNRMVRWLHRLNPLTNQGRTELWHTRLALWQQQAGQEAPQLIELSREHTAPLRAIWSPDYLTAKGKPTTKDPALGLSAMSPNDRHQIVILTSAFRGYEVKRNFGLNVQLAVDGIAAPANPINPGLIDNVLIERDLRQDFRQIDRIFLPLYVSYVPEPFYATQLMLSPLGGWLKSRGGWDPPREVVPPKLPPYVVSDVFKQAIDLPNILRPRAGTDLRAAASFTDANLRQFLTNPNLIGDLVQAQNSEPEQLDLSEWAHIATQGRDHYVRIVYEGVLWPFGHRAALIKVTERKFREHNGIVGAYLMQRMFIVVREPVKKFANNNRAMPYKKVRLTTLVTPNIAEPTYAVADTRAFWVEVLRSANLNDRSRFMFHAVGEDSAGNPSDFTAPLLFVSITVLASAAQTKAVADYYNLSNTLPLMQNRSIKIPGQKVLYAEPDAAAPNENTELVTQSMTFIVDRASTLPKLMTADVSIPAVQEIIGEGKTIAIRQFSAYVAQGFDAGSGVFAEVAKFDPTKYLAENPLAAMVEETLGVHFQAEQAGGFATPNMAVSTLTRKLGPMAGKAADAVVDDFKPAEFFKKGLAKIFGTFDLADLLPAVPASKNAPQIKVRKQDISATEQRIIITLDWQPEVKNLDLGIAAFEKDRAGQTTALRIHGTIEKPIKLDDLGAAPGDGLKAEFTGTLNDFIITVLKSVIINFVEFGFVSKTGAKPDVTVKLDLAKPVEFIGPLKFVEEIRQIIPPGLFGAGASLDIAPSGIRVGFSIALPPVAVGVFALKDVSLGAALTLPILGDGKPTFDFNVSERAHPFVLAISIFGGGGFFRLQLDTAGMKALEISLEFGATLSIDLGVASGGVYIMAGIYFGLKRNDANEMRAELTGYLRMGGYLSVLGLIKVSVEFNLSFTYKEKGKAWGRATLTIEIEIAFFSTSVELTVERQFGGSGSDPKFGQMFETDSVWNEYAAAFA